MIEELKPDIAPKKPQELADVQKTRDVRGIEIDQVGICDLAYPIVVLDRKNQRQHAAAKIAMSVSLPHHFKGTHMSFFNLRTAKYSRIRCLIFSSP